MPLASRTTSLILVSALASRPEYRDRLLTELHTIKEQSVVQREELYEAFLQLYLFAGFPAALEAVRALSRAWPDNIVNTVELAQEAIADYPQYSEMGQKLYKRVYAANADLVQGALIELSPELAAWALVEGYGKTLSRSGLDTLTRELCIVAILTQLEWERQLFSHIHGSRNVSASREAILEAAEIGSLGDKKKFLVAEQLIQKVV
jgi:alkylhydroperoxidase/carboxymuconolactone decarboxylase family protein YurZ